MFGYHACTNGKNKTMARLIFVRSGDKDKGKNRILLSDNGTGKCLPMSFRLRSECVYYFCQNAPCVPPCCLLLA